MSIRIMTQVWDNGPESQGALLVLLALADFADDNGYCYPSIKTVAAKARMTERGAQKIIRSLEADGILEIKTGNGRYGCNQYWVKTSNLSAKKTPNEVHPERGSPPNVDAETPNVDVRNPEPRSPKPSRTVKEPCVADATPHTDFQDFAFLLLGASPKGGTMEEARQIIDDLGGNDPKRLISAMEAYARENEGNPLRYVRGLKSFFSDRFWEKYADPQVGEEKAAMAEHAAKVRNHNAELDGPMIYPPSLCQLLIDAGYLTEADCQKAGIEL